MREILFRGKTTKKELPIREFNEIWVYGDLIKSNGKYYVHPQANQVKVESEIGKLICMHEVIPETVGQFTGSTDKNGKKIFEGDIIQNGENEEYDMFFRKGVVEFREGTFDGGIYKYTGFYYRCKNGDIDHNNIYDNEDNWSKLKVIGNIHDNPELLENE